LNFDLYHLYLSKVNLIALLYDAVRNQPMMYHLSPVTYNLSSSILREFCQPPRWKVKRNPYQNENGACFFNSDLPSFFLFLVKRIIQIYL